MPHRPAKRSILVRNTVDNSVTDLPKGIFIRGIYGAIDCWQYFSAKRFNSTAHFIIGDLLEGIRAAYVRQLFYRIDFGDRHPLLETRLVAKTMLSRVEGFRGSKMAMQIRHH